MYGYSKRVSLGYEEAVAKAKECLKEEGFGVLTEIDVRETLRRKLGVDFDDYVILGACNPPFAYKALQAERSIGVMLPCNIIVHSQDGEIHVGAILPSVQLGKVGNPDLEPIAEEMEKRLKRVVDSI